jgi:hypothetical protein
MAKFQKLSSIFLQRWDSERLPHPRRQSGTFRGSSDRRPVTHARHGNRTFYLHGTHSLIEMGCETNLATTLDDRAYNVRG